MEAGQVKVEPLNMTRTQRAIRHTGKDTEKRTRKYEMKYKGC